MKSKTETMDESYTAVSTNDDSGSAEDNKLEEPPSDTHPSLTKAQQQELLRLARATITAYLQTGQILNYETDDPALTCCAGVFVTLWGYSSFFDSDSTEQPALNIPASPDLFPERQLRGCIGHVWTDKPLYLITQEMVIAAATRDLRLPPVTLEELDEIRIEISILSAICPLNDLQQIQIGKHGLMIVQGGRRGLLLPEVPVERGWDRTTFLKALCLKAGLPLDSWPDQATLYTFTTLKFGE